MILSCVFSIVSQISRLTQSRIGRYGDAILSSSFSPPSRLSRPPSPRFWQLTPSSCLSISTVHSRKWRYLLAITSSVSVLLASSLFPHLVSGASVMPFSSAPSSCAFRARGQAHRARTTAACYGHAYSRASVSHHSKRWSMPRSAISTSSTREENAWQSPTSPSSAAPS